MFRYIITTILILSCLHAQQQMEQLKKDIYLWQYQRQGIDKLAALLEHKDNNIRLLSVEALGLIK